MSLYPDTTPSSSAAMPEQSADVSSTPLHAHAVSWVSTSSTTCRMYSTEQPLCLPVQAPKHTEISSQTDGRKNSRATHPAFFILMTRNRGDAYQAQLTAHLFAHKNPDIVLETPKNGGSEGKKRTKMPYLCSRRRGLALGREEISIGKHNMSLPANHRAYHQNINT